MFSIRLFKEEISCMLQVLHSSLLFPRTLKLTMCLLGNGTATLVSSRVAVVKKLFLFSSLPVFGAYSLQMFWTMTICNILLQNLPSHFLVILLPLWGGKFDFFHFFFLQSTLFRFFCLFVFYKKFYGGITKIQLIRTLLKVVSNGEVLITFD